MSTFFDTIDRNALEKRVTNQLKQQAPAKPLRSLAQARREECLINQEKEPTVTEPTFIDELIMVLECSLLQCGEDTGRMKSFINKLRIAQEVDEDVVLTITNDHVKISF